MSLITFLKKRRTKKHLKGFIKHIRYILHVNDDILMEKSREKLNALISDAENINMEDDAAVSEFLREGPLRAVKILPKKTHPVLREYADIFAVALTVAFGLRALFLQPFKIPTSSMQPTLFGIHYIADKKLPDGSNTLPHLPWILHSMLFATQEAKATVIRTGKFDPSSRVSYDNMFLCTNTRFNIGGVHYNLPGDISHIFTYCDFQRKVNTEKMILNDINAPWIYNRNQIGPKYSSTGDYVKLSYMDRDFYKGDTLCNGWLSLGDHLFVDRVSIHFREPARGDITVFTTEGINTGRFGSEKGYFYIKRLIGMPGDTLKDINNMVYVKPKGASEYRPITDFGIEGINRVYSGKGGYHGHLAEKLLGSEEEREYTAAKINNSNPPAKVRFADDGGLIVPEDCYFMMGDNSVNSHDSRAWGFVPRKNIIGRAFFVFWPLSRRWGFAGYPDPVDVKTERSFGYLPAMSLQ